jgi:hypothetical protein
VQAPNTAKASPSPATVPTSEPVSSSTVML